MAMTRQFPIISLRSLKSATGAIAAGFAVFGMVIFAPTVRAAQQEDAVTKDKASQDPFLWLEDVDGKKSLDWVRAQNDRSLKELTQDARFKGFEESALKIVNDTNRIAAPSIVGENVRNFWQDENHVRGIWRQSTLKSYVAGTPEWTTILDLDALAKSEDENWVWEGATCLSPDQDRCVLTLSRGGSDAAVRREFIVSTQSFVEDGFNLPEMKAGMAWMGQDTMLVGGDIADDGLTDSGYPRVTRVWKRGQKVEDSIVLFEGEKTDTGIWPATIARGEQYFSYITQSHTFYERDYYMIASNGQKLARIPLPKKSSIEGYMHGTLIVSLQTDWTPVNQPEVTFKSGDIVGVSVFGIDSSKDIAEAKLFNTLIFSPNEKQSVQSVRVVKQSILVQLLDNIVGSVKRFDYKLGEISDGTSIQVNWVPSDVDLPGEGDVSLGSVDEQGSDFFLYFDSPVEPATLYYVNAARERIQVKQSPALFNANGVVMRQFEATSKDGTKVPYFVIGREAVMEAGNAPTIQYGYGGFEIPITPGYSALTGKLWYENDGLYVIANIRGGGEFGPRWHQAALKENRQRAFDDFFAVSEDLIAKGLTSSEKLGALGGSNGGLLMGVAMTQRPDLYNAIGIGVPLLDMKRYHTLLAGASWMGEYGNPDLPEEWAFISKYSPYQNIDKDDTYPRVYFFTSTKDDRVHPGHARKMAAKMESYEQPFLYYENIEGGHGAAANLKQAAYRQALQYTYFMRQLADPAP